MYRSSVKNSFLLMLSVIGTTLERGFQSLSDNLGPVKQVNGFVLDMT